MINNHPDRPINVLTDWWQRAGIGTDLSRIFVLIMLALGTGFIFNTVFLWPRQSPPEFNQITVERTYQLAQREQAVIVDARDPEPYARNHIAGSVNLPLTQFDKYYPDFARQVEKSQTVILYCAAGCTLKEKVAILLQRRGYQDVNVMSEGPDEWVAAGYPVATRDDTHRAEGERQ